jgi:hypothetical protein
MSEVNELYLSKRVNIHDSELAIGKLLLARAKKSVTAQVASNNTSSIEDAVF